MGGLTTDSNLIKLTYKEHLFAHLTLYKKYKQEGNKKYTKSMLFALCKLIYLPRSFASSKIFKYGFKKAEIKYKNYITNISELIKGENNPNYGNKWTDK